MLHFKRFMSEYGPPPPHFIEQLKTFDELSEAYAEMIQKYSEFLVILEQLPTTESFIAVPSADQSSKTYK